MNQSGRSSGHGINPINPINPTGFEWSRYNRYNKISNNHTCANNRYLWGCMAFKCIHMHSYSHQHVIMRCYTVCLREQFARQWGGSQLNKKLLWPLEQLRNHTIARPLTPFWAGLSLWGNPPNGNFHGWKWCWSNGLHAMFGSKTQNRIPLQPSKPVPSRRE